MNLLRHECRDVLSNDVEIKSIQSIKQNSVHVTKNAYEEERVRNEAALGSPRVQSCGTQRRQ